MAPTPRQGPPVGGRETPGPHKPGRFEPGGEMGPRVHKPPIVNPKPKPKSKAKSSTDGILAFMLGKRPA